VPELSGNNPEKRRAPPDASLSDIASRQHGVVTVAQLRVAGFDDEAIGYRSRAGRLHRLHRGVYAVGYRRVTRNGWYLAAVLALGPDATLSHWSAAALWGLVDHRDGAVDVTVARNVRSRRGLRVHSVRHLPPGDRTRTLGIAVTTVPRTLLDLTDVANDRVLRRAVNEAFVRRRADEAAVHARLGRAAGRRNASRLADLLSPGPARTRSELEDRFLDLVRAHGLPRPQVNVPLENLPEPVEVDFLFPDRALVVETDGARFHDNPVARARDARRQAMLEAAGYRVVRVTWRQLTERRAETARRLRHAL